MLPRNNEISKPYQYSVNLKNSKVMPRMKTKAAAKKRFTFTGTGKIKRKHAYHSHILTKKETTQKRNLDHTTLVSRDDEARVKRMLLA